MKHITVGEGAASASSEHEGESPISMYDNRWKVTVATYAQAQLDVAGSDIMSLHVFTVAYRKRRAPPTGAVSV